MLGRILIALIAVGVVALGAWALWPKPVQVETALVEPRSLDVAVEEEGKSRIREIFTVSAPVAGQLARLTLHAGDSVTAGETVVATIHPAGSGLLDERSRRIAETAVATAQAAVDLASAQVAQTQTQLNYLESELARSMALAERGLIPDRMLEKAGQDVEAARSAVESARAGLLVRQRELDSAKAALIVDVGDGAPEACCAQVTAPVSGQILQVLTESEQVVQAGTPLMEVGDPHNLEIVVDLLSRDAVRVEPGAAATIDGWGGQPLKAEVERIDPIAVTKVSALGIEEQRTTVMLRLLDPPELWQRLGHGFRVVVRIVLWQGKDLLAIPTGALFRQGNRWATFVVAGGKASVRLIELGERNSDLAEVRGGLAAEEVVILHPSDTIADGTAVSVVTPEVPPS